jgi:hypothetical protein
MIDLVYLYTAGSNTNEIRYSLRSMQKHLKNIGRVFIVGDDPGIFKDMIYVPCENKWRHNGARNIYDKIMTACRHPDLSQNFGCCSDDYFLLKDFDLETLPYFHCGTLSQTIQKLCIKYSNGEPNAFRIHCVNTFNALIERKLPEQNFNIHFPIVYNKEKYIEIMSAFDWEIPRGYISKSTYTNSLKIPGEYMADVKIHAPKTKPAILRRLKNESFFSTNEHSINDPMLEFMQEQYPEPSMWE